MFVKANYEVRTDENDFPTIGGIGITEVNGKDVSVIVREIVSLEWKKSVDIPTLVVKVIVEINDKDLADKPKKNLNTKNKFLVIEGGKMLD